MKLSVMTYNIRCGGYYLRKKPNDYSYIENYVDLIEKNNIDVIAFQESKAGGYIAPKHVAEKLGYYFNYFRNKDEGISNSIVSKYPIMQTWNDHCIAQINLGDKLFLIANIHLTDVPFPLYSLNGIRYYKTPKNISESEAIAISYEARIPHIGEVLNLLDINSDQETAAILLGDFNEPSHLDSHIEWGLSKKLISEGYCDLVRDFYPDSQKFPMHSNYVDVKDDVNDMPSRIDFIYYNNGLEAISAMQLDDVKLSDHKPIVGVFEV